ncbi:MAG: metal-dependent hydrolase [Clostridiaceae bacterium]|nr:metal-dependent hydrolase [Clostridiaceae bacterium]
MDPISHGIIGLGIYSLQNTPTLSSAACLAAILGSVSPDFDIIARIKGDYVYLHHHRVESHSIPGLVILSGLITAGLSLFYNDFSFYQVFLWAFIGGLSHTLFDLFNSYGVALLYPFNRKKYSLSLLMIYDPVFMTLSLYSTFFGRKSIVQYYIMATIALFYLTYRYIDRKRLGIKLMQVYKKKYIVKKINVMPSDFNLMKWDYIIDTDSHYIVGEMNSLTSKVNAIKSLEKVMAPIIEKSLKNQLGMYFENFTPIFHVDLIQEKERFIVTMTDLRYRMKNEFKHHAIFYYDEDESLKKSIFHPFSKNNVIEVYTKESADAR